MILFQNNGLIPIRAITTFGVNAKQTEGAIGHFGTGLKYAIAVILREGGSITIWRGKKAIGFSTKQTTIRGKFFNTVTMNGSDVGFTTELGKGWATWMAFRELYCNAMDEGGFATRVGEPVTGEAEKTKIVVSGADFENIWDQRSDIILQSQPLCKTAHVEIHAGNSEYVFYRGIRAYRMRSPSIFTYNITKAMELSEDRQIKYSFLADASICQAIVQLSDESVIQSVLTAPEGRYEYEIEFSSIGPTSPSERFMAVMARLRSAKVHLSAAAMQLFVRHSGTFSFAAASLIHSPNFLEKERISKAIAAVNKAGIPLTEGEVRVVSGTPNSAVVYTGNGLLELNAAVLDGSDEDIATIMVMGFAELRSVSSARWLARFIAHGDTTPMAKTV